VFPWERHLCPSDETKISYRWLIRRRGSRQRITKYTHGDPDNEVRRQECKGDDEPQLVTGSKVFSSMNTRSALPSIFLATVQEQGRRPKRGQFGIGPARGVEVR